MSGYRTDEGWLDRSRTTAILAVVAVHLALGFALLRGLGVALPHPVSDGLTLLDVTLPPPPPPERPVPQHRASPRKEGASSPPNLRAKATEVVAPPPIVPPPLPPPLPAAPIAGIGTAPPAGAAPIRGPGTGSGGIGDGTGSGGYGTGDGGGGGSPPRLLSGHIHYPHTVPDRGIDETVGLRFIVGVKGRVTACVVTEPSGNKPMDAIVCDLIERELRYRPEKDASGHPVPSEITGTQSWSVHSRDRADEPDDDSR